MEHFLKRHEDRISGIITGFDRILFRGTLRSISHMDGMNIFLSSKRVLLKDFSKYVQELSGQVKQHVQQVADKAGRPMVYVKSPKLSKEDIAKQIKEKDQVEQGLICVIGCVEICQSFGIRKDGEKKRIKLISEHRQCLHYYFYYMDREFGFMHVRLQSWLPFQIQVYINGREYLARQMQKAAIGYEQRDNCFTWIENLKKAQAIIDRLESRKWERVLKAFAQRLNPLPKRLNLKPYYWSMAQSEYATDIMFNNPQSLAQIYPALVRHSIEQFDSKSVLRFLQRQTNQRFKGEVKGSLEHRLEGVRVKFWVEGNSIKMYDKQGSVLRIETTINNPRQLKVRRQIMSKGRKQMRWVRMRKAVADIERRIDICRSANERFLEALSVVGTPKPSCRLLDSVSKRVQLSGRSYRALRPVAPQDAQLFQLILRGEFLIQGFRNKDLRPIDSKKDSKTAARISRLLALLRAHGLIYKVARTNYYRITKKGQEVMTTAIKFRHSDIALLAA